MELSQTKFGAKNDRVLTGQSVLVLAVCCSFLVLTWVKLSQELYPVRQTSTQAVVGELGFMSNQVERRHEQEVIWSPVIAKDALYSRDAVRTAQNSEAKVVFDDGVALDLSENSMVILERTPEKLAIEFLSGFVSTQSKTNGRALEIKTKEGTITSRDGALSLRGDAKGMEVSVLQGQAQIKTKDGTRALSDQERGLITAQGIKTERIPFIIQTPRPNARVVVSSQANDSVLPFEWHSAADLLQNITLELADDPTFKRVQKKITVRSGEKISVPVGGFYWRLSAVRNGLKQVSDVRFFRVLKHPGVRPEYPLEGDLVENVTAKKPLRVSWAPLASKWGAVDEVQVSAEQTFSKLIPIQEQHANGALTEGLYSKLSPGEYYWRVLSRYPDGQEYYSSTQKFTVDVHHAPVPGGLKAHTPQPAMPTILYAPTSPVAFVWETHPEAKTYTLEIRKGDDLVETAQLSALREGKWTWEKPQLGTWNWSVRALNENKETLAQTPSTSFQVLKSPEPLDPKPLAPLAQQIYTAAESQTLALPMSWDKQPGEGQGVQYQLEYRSESESKDPIVVAENHYPASLAPGKYTWSVRTVDGWGRKSAGKLKQTFEVRAYPQFHELEFVNLREGKPLRAPELVPVSVRWKEKGAKKPTPGRYLVQLEKKDGKSWKVLQKITTRDPVFALSKEASSGDYRVQVVPQKDVVQPSGVVQVNGKPLESEFHFERTQELRAVSKIRVEVEEDRRPATLLRKKKQ